MQNPDLANNQGQLKFGHDALAKAEARPMPTRQTLAAYIILNDCYVMLRTGWNHAVQLIKLGFLTFCIR